MIAITRYLIDTHILIWWMEKSKRLNKVLFSIINNPQNQIFVSVASVWEIVIKIGKKRLKIPVDIEGDITIRGLRILPIEISHVLHVGKLANYHKDPFDRILVAQAKVENLTLITADEKIWKYTTKVIKA